MPRSCTASGSARPPHHYTRWTKLDRERAINLRLRGYSEKAIARKLGRTPFAVSRLLKLVPRSSGGIPAATTSARVHHLYLTPVDHTYLQQVSLHTGLPFNRVLSCLIYIALHPNEHLPPAVAEVRRQTSRPLVDGGGEE